MRFRATPDSSTLRRTPALARESFARRTHGEDKCPSSFIAPVNVRLGPNVEIAAVSISSSESAPLIINKENPDTEFYCTFSGGQDVIGSRCMWLCDCPVLPRGQDGRQLAPGSSFSEVSPATTLPSRCLANARLTEQPPPVPGSPEPASCKTMPSLTSQHMLQPKIALRGSRPSHATPSTESSASAYFSRNCRRTSSSAFHMPRPAASSSRARTFR